MKNVGSCLDGRWMTSHSVSLTTQTYPIIVCDAVWPNLQTHTSKIKLVCRGWNIPKGTFTPWLNKSYVLQWYMIYSVGIHTKVGGP